MNVTIIMQPKTKIICFSLFGFLSAGLEGCASVSFALGMLRSWLSEGYGGGEREIG